MCLVCPCLDNARTGDMTECTGKTIRNGCPKLFKTLSQPMAAEWLGQRRRMRAEHRTEYWWLLMCQELLWLSIMNMYSNPARENRPQPTRSNSGCFISHRVRAASGGAGWKRWEWYTSRGRGSEKSNGRVSAVEEQKDKRIASIKAPERFHLPNSKDTPARFHV